MPKHRHANIQSRARAVFTFALPTILALAALATTVAWAAPTSGTPGGTDTPRLTATLATADGTQLESWSNLHFNFNEPISHIHIIGGRSPSYMPWRADAPGALLVDNIRVCHTLNGTTLVIR